MHSSVITKTAKLLPVTLLRFGGIRHFSSRPYSRLRRAYGVECPEIKCLKPKAHPSVLLVQQRGQVDEYNNAQLDRTNKQDQDV